MQTIQELQKLTNHIGSITIKPASALYETNSEQVILDIKTSLFTARCTTQGAQLLEFSTQNADVLWLSSMAKFDGENAIRGGIPICLPWFGVNRRNPSLNKHGFARNRHWDLVSVEESNETIRLHFRFIFKGDSDFPTPFETNLILTLNESIDISISIKNDGTKAVPFSFALHNYFCVDHSHNAKVTFLDKTQYLDNTNALNKTRQNGAITFLKEVDRIYENCPETQYLEGVHTFAINSKNMPTAIVWNPNNNTINDIKHQYTKFICVERGAAFANELLLEPKQTYTGSQLITIK